MLKLTTGVKGVFFISFLDNGVMMSPKRRNIISLVFK